MTGRLSAGAARSKPRVEVRSARRLGVAGALHRAAARAPSFYAHCSDAWGGRPPLLHHGRPSSCSAR
eukprot:14820017-Alexandrium_andersonii.AAC.1